MLVPNHTQRRKRGMYSALHSHYHSVHDQTILFTWPSTDYSQRDIPRANEDCRRATSYWPNEQCDWSCCLSGIHTNQWKTSALDAIRRQNKIHS
jgi:hypothetical protein